MDGFDPGDPAGIATLHRWTCPAATMATSTKEDCAVLHLSATQHGTHKATLLSSSSSR